VAKFKYLGATLRNQDGILIEIKSSLILEKACSYSVQNLLSFHLISKNLKIQTYKTEILPVVLYGFSNLSLTLKDEQTDGLREESAEEVL
jgi:hypothetical protein